MAEDQHRRTMFYRKANTDSWEGPNHFEINESFELVIATEANDTFLWGSLRG